MISLLRAIARCGVMVTLASPWAVPNFEAQSIGANKSVRALIDQLYRGATVQQRIARDGLLAMGNEAVPHLVGILTSVSRPVKCGDRPQPPRNVAAELLVPCYESEEQERR